MKLSRYLGNRLKRIRTFWPRHRRTCLGCGYFAFKDGAEAKQGARRIVFLEGQDGWFSDEAAVDCYKGKWFWDDGEAAVSIITYEANRHRYGCGEFLHYRAGRSPADHLKLEDERRVFQYQLRLAVLSFLGALIGALIGAVGARWVIGPN